MGSAGGLQTSLWRGCPIGSLRAHSLHAAPPERFAGLRVLHRPSAPRHPPGSLSSLSSRRGLHLSPDLRQERWIGVMMCSLVVLCFAFASVFSAKSKSSSSLVQVHPQVPQHLKS